MLKNLTNLLDTNQSSGLLTLLKVARIYLTILKWIALRLKLKLLIWHKSVRTSFKYQQ